MIQHIDVSDLSLKETEQLIEKMREKFLPKPEIEYTFNGPIPEEEYQSRMDIVAYQMQKEMGRRHADPNKRKYHPTQELSLHGETVDIDEDMIPIVKWLNNLPNTFTTFCCQGDVDEANDGKHKRPYVLFYSKDQSITEYIIKKFTEFHQHSATLNVMHSYHQVTTEVDYFMGGVRYASKWYDNIALKDFIKWAGLE